MRAISLDQLSQLARNLAGLLRLGYPPVEAVQKLQRAQSPALAAVLERSVAAQQQGQTLAGSLATESGVLPLFTRLLESAEKAEALPEGLERAANLMDDLAARRSRCFQAALYPLIVLTVMVVFVWAICLGSGRLIEGMYGQVGLELPTSTLLMLRLGEWGSHPLGAMLFFAPLVLLWLVLLGRAGSTWTVYRLPIFGSWLLRQEAVIYLGTMGQLVQLGTPLVEASRLAVEVCSPLLRERLLPVSERLQAGDRLSQALAPAGVVPELGRWAIERRESAESLPLLEICEFLDHELEVGFDRGLVLFEPLIFLAVLGGLVFVISAVFVPLYRLIGNLG